jgi:tape measure domain-containing protein
VTTVATLDTVLRLNSTAFRQGMVDAAATANKSLSSIQATAQETASVLLSLKRAAGTLGELYLVKETVGSLVDAQKQLQAISYTFQAATGNIMQGAQAFDFVRAESEKLGLYLPDAAQGFAKLSASATAAGVTMKDQQQLFDAFAKSATTLHLSTDNSNRALLALEQMFAKGKVQAQELRLQLGQAIPGAAQRFQNAVMQMTKGTDLAGKSFDQLLEEGKLTTSQFLPALITALQQTSQGWEGASQGLQASLNRLQTAWFNLKTEVSTGLFSDVVTGGASLLASNLTHIASLVGIIGASAGLRALGQGLGGAAGKAGNAIQQAQGTSMAATAEREYQERLLARATAQVEAAESAALLNNLTMESAASSLQDAKAKEIEAFGIKEVATAEMQRIETAIALNERLATGAAAERTAIALNAELATATQAATIAEQQMTAAIVEQTAARATLARSSAAQAGLGAVTSEAVALETAAAKAAAGARVVEAEVTGLSAAIRTGATSFGQFALALAGGPWGLAAIAIGGVTYAIYDAIAAHKAYDAESVKQVESLQQIAQAANDAAKAYGTFGDTQKISTLAEQSKSDQDAIGKTKAEIADLEDQIRHLQDAQGQQGGGGMLAGLHLEEMQDRLAKLKASLPDTETAVGNLDKAISGGLTPAVDGLKNAIATLKDGGSLWDAIGQLATPDDIKKQQKAIEDAQTGAATAFANISGMVKSMQTKLDNDTLTHVQRVQKQYAEGVQNLVVATPADKLPDALNAARDQASIAFTTAAKLDAAEAAKKNASAMNAEENQYKSLIATINARITQDKQAQIDQTSLTAAQKLSINTIAQLNEGHTKLSAAEQARVRALLAVAVAQGEATRAAELQRDADKALLDNQRQLTELADQQARTNARQLEGADQSDLWNSQQKGIESVRDQYRQLRVEADKAYEAQKLQKGDSEILDAQHLDTLQQITQAENDAITAQRKFYDDQAALNADWSVGYRKAINQFQADQQNQAAIAQQATTGIINSFSENFQAFVTHAKTAKQAAGDFLDYLFEMAVKIETNKYLAQLLGGGSQPGDAGSGGSNDMSGLGGIFQAWLNGGGFSTWGGVASGGAVSPGGIYRVNENGPEVATFGGKSFLMTGAQPGYVTNAQQVRNGGGASVTNITNISVQPTSTRRTADQIATANARTQRLSLARNS